MKNRNLIKLAFDMIMLLLFALMYNTSATGVDFHETGGLALFCLFIVHVAYNRKWVINVGKLLFSSRCKGKQRVMYGLNCLLLLSFTVVCISGLMISQNIFESAVKGSEIWLTLHILSALCALVLSGVHVGLHWKFILGVLKKAVAMPIIVRKVLAVVFFLL